MFYRVYHIDWKSGSSVWPRMTFSSVLCPLIVPVIKDKALIRFFLSSSFICFIKFNGIWAISVKCCSGHTKHSDSMSTDTFFNCSSPMYCSRCYLIKLISCWPNDFEQFRQSSRMALIYNVSYSSFCSIDAKICLVCSVDSKVYTKSVLILCLKSSARSAIKTQTILRIIAFFTSFIEGSWYIYWIISSKKGCVDW